MTSLASTQHTDTSDQPNVSLFEKLSQGLSTMQVGLQQQLARTKASLLPRDLVMRSITALQKAALLFKQAQAELIQSQQQAARELQKKDRAIDNLNEDLERQTNINKFMRKEVMELNELINEHMEINRQKMLQKDEIIRCLKTECEHLRSRSSSDTIKILDESVSTEVSFSNEHNYSITPQHKSSLETIREEEELNTSGLRSEDRNTPNKLTSEERNPQGTFNTHEQKSHQSRVTIRTETERRSSSKTKAQNFIDDFRKTLKTSSQDNLFGEIQDFKMLGASSNSSSQSQLSVARNQNQNLWTPYKNSSPKKCQFIRKKRPQTQAAEETLPSANSTQASSKTAESSNLNSTNPRRRTASKQKIHLTQKENMYASSTEIRTNSREKLTQRDTNVMITSISRPASKEKFKSPIVSRPITTSESSSIRKVHSALAKPTRKAIATISMQSSVREILSKIDLQVGDRQTQAKFQGIRKEGMRVKTGRLQYTNGLLYEGDFKENVRHGRGVLSLNGKQIYRGEWERDKICGQGTLQNVYLINKAADPALKTLVYTGEFQENRFHGKGCLTLGTGERLNCRFNDGLPDGNYTYYSVEGEVQVGTFDYN